MNTEQPVRIEIEIAEEADSGSSWDRRLAGGFLLSVSLHGMLLLILAFLVFQLPVHEERLTATIDMQPTVVEELELTPELTDLKETSLPERDVIAKQLSIQSVPAPSPGFSPQLTRDNPSEIELLQIPEIDLSSHLGGRNAASREKLLEMFGGTPQSERAVERGLKWLAERQREDGSWNFDHRRPGDRHADHQAGSLRSCPIGATSMALMAFLGAGHTHTQPGPYQKAVYNGLEYLKKAGTEVREGIDFRGRVSPDDDRIPGGNAAMYAHGLATIAICEAYGMTRDRLLREHAQGAIEYLIRIRNRDRGGWRYEPEEPGDLSVTGWMIMGLKSAETAGLRFSEIGFTSSVEFLDACQRDGGSQYGYLPGQGAKLSTTSIGLLCRMYLGWEQDHEPLRRGIGVLSQAGPSRENMYYNYYATQVLHHAGGPEWKRWNDTMRDFLVETQRRNGPEVGSWDVTDPHGNRGGRLYQTCLSIMTLEVYYRHLPLYQARAVVKK